MVDDDIDIFSPDFLYHANMRERKETKIEKPTPKTLAEKRKSIKKRLRKDQSEERLIILG